jgi:hypothetical protein
MSHTDLNGIETAILGGKTPGILSLEAEIAICTDLIMWRILSTIRDHITAAIGLCHVLGTTNPDGIHIYGSAGMDMVPEPIAMGLIEKFGDKSAKDFAEAARVKGHRALKHTFITKKLPNGYYTVTLEAGIWMPSPKL